MNRDAGSGDGEPRLRHRFTLGPDLTSAREARRVVRDVLQRAGSEAWVDAVELAASEIVTNATLHAHTPIDVEVEVYDEQVRVEVRDYNPTLPHQRDYDEEATTGRGMGLVAAVVTSYGIEPLGADGKIVWFCVGDDDTGADTAVESWDVEPPAVDAADDCVEVVLRAIPATLWLSARQHHDAILRELVLYLAEHEGIDADLASADRARTVVSNALVAAVEDAQRRGTARTPLPPGHPSPLPPVPPELDLPVALPNDIGPCFAVLQDVLDLAEALAVDGELFIRPALPEIVAVRDWVCEQVIAQFAGVPPAPWPGTAQARFETAVHATAAALTPDWEASEVTSSSRAVIAADDANRIIAVSPALAALTGWESHELVGRRVVVLIPPALREAHVAGFSRHLSTGEAHVLGIPVDLPVRRRDGTDVTCRFLVEQAPASNGRSVYLAWLDPVDGPDRNADA